MKSRDNNTTLLLIKSRMMLLTMEDDEPWPKISGSDILSCCILTIIDWSILIEEKSILIEEKRALYFVIEEEHQITLAANAYNKYK